MSQQARVAIQNLDELHETLATELAAVLNLGEQMLAEMAAIDDLRTAMADNGTRLVAARHARRQAIRNRTMASESIQRATHTHQRACDLANELGSVTSRTRMLLDRRHHPAMPTSLSADRAVAA